MTTYTPLNSVDIASYLMYECNEQGYNWNNTKIQKLLYVCYGIFLVRENTRLCDEYPRAWQYGPVFPRVFNKINKKTLNPAPMDNAPDSVKKAVIDTIKIFGKHTAGTLTAWSHSEDSPWEMVMRDGNNLNSFIPDEFIKNYFAENVFDYE